MPVDDRPRTTLAVLSTVTAQILRGEAIRQYGAICVRNPHNSVEILLITSRDSGRWAAPTCRYRSSYQYKRRRNPQPVPAARLSEIPIGEH